MSHRIGRFRKWLEAKLGDFIVRLLLDRLRYDSNARRTLARQLDTAASRAWDCGPRKKSTR